MLKKKFSSVTSLVSDGNTSFLRAARAGHLEKVLEHLRSNIDINTSNANGLNALHLASKDGHVAVVSELLKRGAIVDSATKKGNTALHIASLAGQEEVVKLLVQHGAAVNVQSQNGFTPLYMAAQENHDSVVKYLLANGANQSLATEDGFTPLAVAMQQGHDKVVAVLLENDTRGKVRLPALHIAAKKDDVKAAKLLLENEHNPDVTSKSGFTPLHIASHYGNEAIANLLIQKAADVNYAAKHNITPLHVAAKWGKTNMVALLLDKGANIESKTRDGLTPLHCAARSGHEQVVDMLLEKGAPISSKTKNGLAPLHMAAQGEHVEAARILLYHRAPVDEVTVDYLTALHVAAHCGHVRVAKLLLDRQADANARALNGFTPLHIACKKNRIKVVELLLKHGASISATTESGLTPLHVASFMGCMNIVIYLLQNEANPDVPTVRGETPLHLAARANQTDIIRILLRNGAQVDARAREQQTPLHIASRLGNVDIVMLLLQHGAQVDTITKDMYTALHIAAKEGQDEVASVLLENGASLNATTKKGFTPLHLAAKYGHIKVAKLLLQREAAVDAQGKNGVTPLHVASHYDHQNVALLLLDKGASPHATAKNGHTPLHIAARKNQMDIATTLLEFGAKANAESKSGFTPLHLSSQEGHLDMSSLLIEHKADTNHHSKNGLTPMHLCAQEDCVNVAQSLLKNGASIDSQTKAGYTPLHVASHFGQANMVKFLLQNGADVNKTTGIGYSPLHQAAQQGHTHIVNILLEHNADPNAITHNGQTAHSIAQKLGYITVMETLNKVTDPTATQQTIISDEKYRVVAPEAMHETFMSDSEEEGGEDTMLGDQPYRYLTVDEMKSLGDDSLPIDVTRDERIDSNRMVISGENMLPPQAMDDAISPQHITQNYTEYTANKYLPDNIDIKHPINVGFLVSFLVDARGGAMRGCRHSGVRVIVPPRSAGMPTRITCRYVKPQRTPHPPPLMEGEALASRVLELGPVGAKFLGPVIIEVPHFAALRGKEREIVILRSDNGETWREHVLDASEDIVQDVLNDSFEAEDLSQLEDISSGRITRILTHDFPQYFAVVSRIRQEVHAIGPEGGMVSSSVVPQVQAVFPQGALTKKIKVGLQAQPIDPDLTAKLLGHGVAVSPVVTVEPRRRKFHKAITLSMPAPRAHTQGMINQYSGSAPTLRLLCSITGGTTRAQWEDVTGSTPLTFVNDCVSFTTTVSARFWLMDCRNIGDATKMATELYREAIHVPFMAKFVVFAKRVDTLEARLRVFCMTDDREDKTLEHQEHFTEVAKSRDVEVLEGKSQYIEFAGNLVPVTKSGDQLQFAFRAFRENRLPFTVRVKDQHADTVGRCLFMREPKVAKGEPPQQPICVLNIVLPDNIVAESYPITETEILKKYGFIKDSGGIDVYQRTELRLSDMSNLLGDDWSALASELGLSSTQINTIKSECPESVPQQAQSMLRLWRVQSGNKAQGNTLELALKRIGRSDIITQCIKIDVLDQAVARVGKDQAGFDNLKDELGPSRDTSLRRNISLDNTYDEQDMMKDSESIESLITERKDSYEIDSRLKNISERDESKYTAEEKVVIEEEPIEAGVDDNEIKKSVAERRIEIEKRLSSDREIPPSLQKHEIVQEICTIKRQSLIDDKIKFNEQIIEEKTKLPIDVLPPSGTKVTTTTVTIVDSKTPKTITEKTTTISTTVQKSDDIIDAQLAKKLAAQKQKIEEDVHTVEDGVVKEVTRPEDKPGVITTTKTTTIVTQQVAEDDMKRRDSALFQNVSNELERLDITTAKKQPSAIPDDLKSPLVSKTPPPSPADFLLREQQQGASETQEWSPASAAELDGRYSATAANVGAAVPAKISPHEEIGQNVIELTSSVPKPKPRATKTEQEAELESYSDRKKFWEQVSTTSEKTAIKDNLQTIIHDAPVPKPRSNLQSSSRSSSESLFYKTDGNKSDTESVEMTLQRIEKEEIVEEESGYKSEYMSQFQHPFLPGDDGNESGAFLATRPLKQLAKDLSIDSQPPKVAQRKTIFERSISLPSDDSHITEFKEKKSYFEQQIKNEMIVEQLLTHEDETTPEFKSIERPLDVETPTEKAKSKSSTIDEFIEVKPSEAEEPKSEPIHDLVQASKRSSTESEVSISSERSVEIEIGDTKEQLNDLLKSESSRPSDSMEVHVDKSELEDSEKITDLELTELENNVLHIHRSEEHIPDTVWEVPVQSESGVEEETVIDDLETIKHESTIEDSKIIEQTSVTEEVVTITKQTTVDDVKATDQILQPDIEEQTIEVGDDHAYTKEAHIETTSLKKPVVDNIETIDDFQSTLDETQETILKETDVQSEHSEAPIETPKHAQVLSETEARDVANALINDLEQEIIKRNIDPPVPDPEIAQNQVSDYLRQLAEAKGLDEREVELVESVLARKQRELTRLTRDNTQTTSSIEITDEDLRYSAETDDSQSDIIPEPSVKLTKPDLSAVTKTIEEVQDSLHAAQEQLIERGIHKKPSPSEFQFKVSQVKLTDQQVELMHERIGIISEFYKTQQGTKIEDEQVILPPEEPTTSLEAQEEEIIGEIPEVKTIKKLGVRSSSEDSTVDESMKSPEHQSLSSSGRKADSDTASTKDVPMRKSRKQKDSDSIGLLNRKSGTDFEGWSSSGESHYQSFELDSSKSRPCSSDVENLLVTGVETGGSSEYESALTSQNISSKSHIVSSEYHTAISSLSSRESMKSLDSESSGHLASVEVSEASETLVPSTMELDGDILDESVLDDEDYETVMKSMVKETSQDEVEISTKMKRSQEMTFQPEPKFLSTGDSPLSEVAENLDERYGSSVEEGSVLSVSYSSTSEVSAARTIIEYPEADIGDISVPLFMSDKSIMDSQSEPLAQLQGSLPMLSSFTEEPEPKENGETQFDYPELEEVVEPKKRGHRRNESTCTFKPSMIPRMIKPEAMIEDLQELTQKEKKDTDEKIMEYDLEIERPQSSRSDSESHRAMSGAFSDDRPDSELTELLKQCSSDTTTDPIDRPNSPEPNDVFEKSESPTHFSGRESELEFSSPYPRSPDYHQTNLELFESKETDRTRLVSSSSEKSSFEEAEAEAVFHMVPHISPAHQTKPIGTIPEDDDAEEKERELLLLNEQLLRDQQRERQEAMLEQSPGSIPDIMVTEHMTPLNDKGFHYPDLEIQEQEREEEQIKSTPQTPASISSKSSEDTDMGREYILDGSDTAIIHEEPEDYDEKGTTTESRSEISGTVEDKTVYDLQQDEIVEPSTPTESPTSDSFEILDKPDIADDFVIIEEVGREANEMDEEGKSIAIKTQKYVRKHDAEVEEYLVRSAPAKMTGMKYYPDGGSDELGPFQFEESPPQVDKKSTGVRTGFEYDQELEDSKKWIEMQFQAEQSAAGYGYEMEFERAPLEDIKEEEVTDFDPNSRIGSLNSQKESGGSYSSVKDSFSSTPEYDVLAGRKFFTRSGEHDDISMSSLQEFENLEQAISLENRRFHHGSQDSLSNGSFSKRYHSSRSGQGDDVSLSSLKEFEGLESACIQAHKIEIKAKEEEALLAQIDEGHESTISESDSIITMSHQKIDSSDDDKDYEQRMFEIDEIIRQAQTNVEQFIDLKHATALDDKTQSLGRGDSIEEVAKIPDLDLDIPVSKISSDVGLPSTDSLDMKLDSSSGIHASTDSLDQKTGGDIMTASTDSIEFQSRVTTTKDIMTDSIEMQREPISSLVTSDSLEAQGFQESPSEGNIQDQCSDIMVGSCDSLDPSSSTATHATYHFGTDSVLSSSFTSGGSNTMVSSTENIDPNGLGGASAAGQTVDGIDLAAALRQVWSDENSYAEGPHSEEFKSNEKPFVTEVIEPCEEDGFSLTIHRMVDLPPEIQRVTFKGADAEQQYQRYIEQFGEGQFVQETEHVDADGNVHVQKVIQNRVIMKDISSDKLQNMTEEELQSYVQSKMSKETGEKSDLDKDYEHLITSISGRETGHSSETVSHRTYVTRHVTPAIIDIRHQGGHVEEDQPKVEAEQTEEGGEQKEEEEEQQQGTSRQRPPSRQHELSEEMKALLAEMEEQSKR